jgi:nucleoside-diphosphate-sugar epimerase
VFLAGSTGLVGTAILKRLLADSPDTFITASRHTNVGPSLNDGRIEYISGDLSSLETCRQMVKGCDCAIMAAAYTGGASLVNAFPWRHIKENLWLNLQILEAFQLEKVPQVVVIGSATMYQDSDQVLSESDLDLNQDPAPAYMGYGWTARFIEKMCRFVHDRFGLQIVVVRAANIFGPYARFDPATSNVIPALIRKAVDKMDPFEVWGDPSATRDVIYSEDFAEAVVKLLDREAAGFEVFNVGSGETTTIDQIVKWALKSAAHEPRAITYVQDRPTTMKHRKLDCSKIRSVLNWAPRHTIEEAIVKTTQWWIENKSSWVR